MPDWPDDPGCVYTCNNFPNVPQMKKVSSLPVLAGRRIEYVCKKSFKIPNTGDRFFINCTDSGKFDGELLNFPGDDWPSCVIGCVEFPDIDNFKPSSREYKLPNDTTEYVCSKAGLVPHTGQNLILNCLENGTFVPTTEIPKCVRPDTCREPSFPNHPRYELNDTSRVAYNYGEMIEMKCKDPELVAEIANFTKETFSVKCGNDRTTPTFENPPPAYWPRCIPRVCVPFIAWHKEQLGTCHCEFDQCSEYIFDRLTNQCPDDNWGPTCALTPYLDNSEAIEDLFEGVPAPNIPTDGDIHSLTRILDRLTETYDKANAVLTGDASPASTTPAPTTTAAPARRKRSYVPIECFEFVHVVENLNDLLDLALTSKVYRMSTMERNCIYILDSPVTNSDCSVEDLASLGTEVTAFDGHIQDLKQKKEDELQVEAATEMARRATAIANYSAMAEVKLQEKSDEFEDRQQAELDLQNSAVEARTATPTTLPPWVCECPSPGGARKKREATTLAPTTTTGAVTTTPVVTAAGATTTPAAATTNAPTNTMAAGPTTIPACVCPEEETTAADTTTTDSNAQTTQAGTTAAPAAATTTPAPATTTPAPATTTLAATTTAAASRRKRRSLEELERLPNFDHPLTVEEAEEHIRAKRAIKYRCNTTVILGIMFYDVYHKSGMLANRCCCPNYKGELFDFFVTIDQPWTNSLTDVRSSIFKDWKKMVDQEVRFMLTNRKSSQLIKDKLLGPIEFVGFQKTPGGKVGVQFELVIKKPHWDNNRRIEQAFADLAEMYKNRTDKTVLGRSVLGRFSKHDYVVDDAPKTHVARRTEFVEEDEDSETSGSGSGEGSGDDLIEEDEGLPLIFFILVPIGSLLILCIPFCVAIRSRACLCKQCC